MHPARAAAQSRLRRGSVTAAAALAGSTALLLPARGALSLASIALLYLVPVVAAAAAGGVRVALGAALTADLLVNFFFVAPYHTLTVERRDNLVTLVVYGAVAAAVAVAMDLAATHRATAERGAVESRLLAEAAGAPVAEHALARLLAEVRDGYGMATVAYLEHEVEVERVGPPADGPPSLSVRAGNGARLVAWGPPLFAEDRGALARLAAAAARTAQTQRLAGEAARAEHLAQTDRLRAALLSAVGHDLRTPLAAIKAAASSLRQPDVAWSVADEAELLATVEESADRLHELVENLLSLSRLQAGALSVAPRPVSLDGVVAQALLSLAPVAGAVRVEVPDDLPLALADPGLLERVIANLVANACTASAPGHQVVVVEGGRQDNQLVLRVIDHGPGIPAAERERMFAPFQRLGDHATTGLGLGLAIAKGFTEAMAGTIVPTETSGGGATITVTLPIAP